MKQKIYFHYPNIINDGIKSTFEIYYNYLKKNYNVILITNSNTKLLNNSNGIAILGSRILLFERINFLNNIFCALKIFFLKKKNQIIFSMDDHLLLLIFKLFRINFKLVIRTPNPIFNIYNKDELRFLNNKGFTNKYETYLYRFANLVITYSKQNVLSLKNKFKVKNVSLIYNFFEKKPERKKNIKKIYNIFFIGRFVDSKDPIFFLRNMIKLINEINIKIYLLGDGILKKDLQYLSKNYKNHIKFLKYTTKPYKKYSKIMDLICITSKFDGTPNVLGEAIARSIPCIAPKNVGLANLLLKNGEYGYLYKQGSDNNFKQKIIYCLKNYKKSIHKSKLALKGLERFDKKNTLKKLNTILSKI
jgi:glycosyltransferase involved in cell wall biosynthesis